MRKYFWLYTLLLGSLYCCKKSTQKVVENIKKSDNNITINHKAASKVNSSSLKKITPWKEYAAFNDFIKRFEKTTPDEAFDNVSELKELTFALEDSLNINSFKNNAFKSRLHVLENEVMRLDDMQDISAITAKEVNLQIDKIFLVFSSLNQKINTVFNQQNFEQQLDSNVLFTMDTKELLEPKRPKEIKNRKLKPRKLPEIKKTLK